MTQPSDGFSPTDSSGDSSTSSGGSTTTDGATLTPAGSDTGQAAIPTATNTNTPTPPGGAGTVTSSLFNNGWALASMGFVGTLALYFGARALGRR